MQVVLQALPEQLKDEGRVKLFLSIERIISNIENKSAGRWISGIGSKKTKLLRTIQDQLLENDGKSHDMSFFLKETMAICQIKRNPLHFWSTPKSVDEFSILAKEHGWQLEEDEVQLGISR